MSGDITIALITGGAAVLGQLIIAYSNRRRIEETYLERISMLEHKIDKSEAMRAKETELTNLKIDSLAEEQKKYNNLQKRTYDTEKLTAVIVEDLKVANHRISDLENIERK